MAWAALLGAVGKAAGFGPKTGWVEWAEMSRNTTPTDVWAAASNHSDNYDAIGRLNAGEVSDAGDVANWAYMENGQWYLPADRAGIDRLAPDLAIPAQRIEAGSVAPSQPTGGGTSGTGETNGTGEPNNPFGFAFGRVRPRKIVQRRCPPGMRLGKDGWCYPSKMLPAAARENNPKKAVVSWSDGNHIRKGRAAQKRLARLNNTGVREARKLIPRRRRLKAKD